MLPSLDFNSSGHSVKVMLPLTESPALLSGTQGSIRGTLHLWAFVVFCVLILWTKRLTRYTIYSIIMVEGKRKGC